MKNHLKRFKNNKIRNKIDTNEILKLLYEVLFDELKYNLLIFGVLLKSSFLIEKIYNI